MRRPRAARAVPGTPRAACRRASDAMREGRIWRLKRKRASGAGGGGGRRPKRLGTQAGTTQTFEQGFGWYSLSIVIPIWAVLAHPGSVFACNRPRRSPL